MPTLAAGRRPGRPASAAVLVAALLLALGAAVPARAATVTIDAGVLRYSAGPSEANDLDLEPTAIAGTVQVVERGKETDGSAVTVTAGPGCLALVDGIYCGGPGDSPRSAEVTLGDEDDRVDVVAALAATVSGGEGADEVQGGARDDVLDGGTGADELRGGAGDDTIGAAQDGAEDVVSCGAGDADAATADASDVVADDCEAVELVTPPPTPTPTPAPTSEPTPTPEPTSTSTPTPEPTPAPADTPPPEPDSRPGQQEPPPDGPPATPPPRGEELRLLVPRPVVRIAGRLTRRGARVRVLEVTAPAGSRVTVTCTGRKCPARRAVVAVKGSRAGAVRRVRLRRFQRPLVAGTVLDIAVTRPGSIGKHTRFVIRRGKPPRRSDGCVNPGLLLIRCPA